MKKTFLQISSLLFLLVFASCSSVRVTWDWDRDADFANLKTFEFYGWANNSDNILNTIDRTRIERSVSDEFTRRGITNVAEGGDMVVALFVVTEQRQETTATSTSSGVRMNSRSGWGGFYGSGPGWSYGTSRVQTTVRTTPYTVGTLIISVFDRKNETLIWEGAASGTIDSNPQNRDRNIPRAIERVMRNYPVDPLPRERN